MLFECCPHRSVSNGVRDDGRRDHDDHRRDDHRRDDHRVHVHNLPKIFQLEKIL